MQGDPMQHIYIPPTSIGACVGLARLCVGSLRPLVGSARPFGYQHVGIGKAKLLCCRSRPTRDHNASGFVLQWNIG